MKNLSCQQHQVLEDLTGRQMTRQGQTRKKQNRTRDQTLKLGLKDPHWELNLLFARLYAQPIQNTTK